MVVRITDISEQMPIVDGLTSTKMIRSHEKVNPNLPQSQRASLNKRVPIIAVSASLLEREKPSYTDAGFDGWILKPISFDRLSNIMSGLVDDATRKDNLYRPGSWERGGWFDEVVKDASTVDTKPDEEAWVTAPSKAVKIAAVSDDPFVDEDDQSTQTQEQRRLLLEQKKGSEEIPRSLVEQDQKAQALETEARQESSTQQDG